MDGFAAAMRARAAAATSRALTAPARTSCAIWTADSASNAMVDLLLSRRHTSTHRSRRASARQLFMVPFEPPEV